jgi:hypothetical protein
VRQVVPVFAALTFEHFSQTLSEKIVALIIVPRA